MGEHPIKNNQDGGLFMTFQSMTAFASATGQNDDFTWVWDIRSVNGRGLDLRIRVPDWIPGLEPALRKAFGAALSRGSLQVSLRVNREEAPPFHTVDPAGVATAVRHLEEISKAADAAGLPLLPVTAADVFALPGVLMRKDARGGEDALAQALIAQIPDLVEAIVQMRSQEGAALQQVLSDHIDHIADLVDRAAVLLPRRSDERKVAFARALDRLRAEIEPERLSQEMAMLAVKTDVAEEIDRLRGHIAAARDILDADGPHGRKLDFLSQEFNREANTLCAKSQDAGLTSIGLDLKLVIDRMREQIQNVE